jgi:hypothetical protein
MAHYRGLERCTYFDRPGEPLVELTAVGWLERPHSFEQGGVPAEVLERLFALVETVWDPIRFRGGHTCDLCSFGARELRSETGRVADVGSRNLFVPMPGNSGLFVAPSLILHYVLSHRYRPPAQFQLAVMACPATSSSSYFRRVEPLIPTSTRWRDGLFGYWTSMGAALAAEAGSMSCAEFDALFEAFREGRFSFSSSDLAPEAPSWFARRHLEPLTALAKQLQLENKSDDARAVEAWLSSVVFLGRCAPAEPRAGW